MSQSTWVINLVQPCDLSWWVAGGGEEMRRKEARYQVVWSSCDGAGLTVISVQFGAMLVMSVLNVSPCFCQRRGCFVWFNECLLNANIMFKSYAKHELSAITQSEVANEQTIQK